MSSPIITSSLQYYVLLYEAYLQVNLILFSEVNYFWFRMESQNIISHKNNTF